MRPEIISLLLDMRKAADEIAGFCEGKTLDEFLRNRLLKRGVERCFEIIGEALNQLRKVAPEIAEGFSEWRSIISFRNVLIHGYAIISDLRTWDIVENDLPVLRRELQQLLENLKVDERGED